MTRHKRRTKRAQAGLGAANAPRPRGQRPALRRAGLASLLLAAALCSIVTYAWWRNRSEDQSPVARAAAGAPAAPASFVANTLCLGCHAEQAQQWRSSHHALAMAPPTADTVRGDFDDAEFRHAGVTSRFHRSDAGYFVRTEGPDGATADFEIAYTFGWAPLQQYLVAMPGGRLQALQVAWDSDRRRWFHLRPDEDAPPGDVLHWTGRYQTANTMCISCHTTGFEKNYDAAADSFASTWHEPNVSCQACHGPGGHHVAWAAGRRDVRHIDYGLTVDLVSAGAQQQADVCAACHSRRSELTASAVPGEPRLDHFLPSLLLPGLYHPDGQQLDEVYVDGSYRQSRMFAMGVRCTACHDAHTGKLELAGDGVCLQCHSTPPNVAFPTAAGAFDTPAHHHHEPGSPGARCVNCHMPARTYMQIQPRPDHSLRVPRPDLSVKIGTPNACNACHANRSPHWAAEQVERWYGPDRRREPHYGEVFAAARGGHAAAGDALVGLLGDPRQPAIVRATALDALRADPATGLSERIAATRDADAEVRSAAADSLAAAPSEQRTAALVPLLRDPVRAVRIAAARSLSSLTAAQIGDAHRSAFDAALGELIAVQSLSLDMPGARLNLGVVHDNLGRSAEAELHYLAALQIDPDFTPARANLAAMYNAAGRNGEAERVLRAGLERIPDIGELQYSLGLLLAEEQRLPEAAEALSRAAALLPERARVHYNLGLALQQLGRRDAAESALLAARNLDPRDPGIVYALAIFHAQGGDRARALEWAEALQELVPDDPDVRRFVAEVRIGQPTGGD